MYDLMIIGSGPAGISAALTAKARNLNFIWFGSRALSTKIEKAEKIMNYPGLPAVTGSEMQSVFLKQIDDCGITITESQVNSIYDCGGYFAAGADNEIYEAKAVIMTVGMTTTREIEGEARLLGCGVSYCATCDAMFYRNKTVAVAGFSKDSESEARFLSEVASKVYYVPYTDSDLCDTDKITVIHDKIIEITGEQKVTGIRFKESRLQVDAVFILRDCIAPDRLIPGLKIENNHVCTDRKMRTNIRGCFAAGDITGTPYQYIKSAGEGNVAALSAVEYLSKK